MKRKGHTALHYIALHCIGQTSSQIAEIEVLLIHRVTYVCILYVSMYFTPYMLTSRQKDGATQVHVHRIYLCMIHTRYEILYLDFGLTQGVSSSPTSY